MCPLFTTRRRAVVLAVATALGSAACSSGSDDSGSNSVLQGTWFGTQEQSDGTLVALSVDVSGSNNINGIVADGVNSGLTGSISPIQGRPGFYQINLSDGTEGGFFADPTSQYVVFLDEDLSVGVLQKGANSLPNAQADDLNGRSYEGLTVELTGSLDIESVVQSQVSVAGDSNFAGDDVGGGTFTSTSPLTLTSAMFGVWDATFDSTGPSGPASGSVRVFASPDKSFIGTWACAGSIPGDCSISVWRAQ